MKRSSAKYNALTLFLALMTGAVSAVTPAFAGSLQVRSAVVAPGASVMVPVEISGDVQGIRGYQMDLQATPSSGAPDLSLQAISKGAAVTTAPNVDTNPVLPVSSGSLRIGLPTEIPASGNPVPDFNGPGSIVDLTFTVPPGAVIGQSYQIGLSQVILAGPDSLAIPVSVFGGTLTVGGITALADTIAAPPSLTVAEGLSVPLTVD
ncbi:MAG: hypothetical protein HY851_09440, partial [candidate division Zixibacteria bacterium]|nr:hypothetical protein [candidate division Zixibacteria bacterium]